MSSDGLHVLFVAAENDALPGGKVGGVADVVRDVPPALVALPEFSGSVTVVIPSYGFLHASSGRPLGQISFRFRGTRETAELYEVPGKRPLAHVRQLVIHHPDLEYRDPHTSRHRIYCDDPPDHPFATDASRFALFSAAVAEALRDNRLGPINRLHLHDWHCGAIQILRRFDPRYAALQKLPTAFTIHNLALQGIRPLRDDASSLESWFPDLNYDPDTVGDPEYADCVNLMAAGIRLSDHVHAVSPSYADEICQPSLPERNHPDCVFFGGEGLERDLQAARQQGRLAGILNGCEYPPNFALPVHTEASWQRALGVLAEEVRKWPNAEVNPRHVAALARLQEWNHRPRPKVVMTSVTRVADQKVRWMRVPESPSPIERILARSNPDAIYILAGSGDSQYENFFAELVGLYDNFIFLNGFSIPVADILYDEGDLFLMPSAFEPCGISQMLAMRSGQPCVAHAIGGLKDTIHHGETGFLFSGRSPEELGQTFVKTTLDAVRLPSADPDGFQRVRQNALQARFLWSDSARLYVEKLYR